MENIPKKEVIEKLNDANEQILKLSEENGHSAWLDFQTKRW